MPISAYNRCFGYLFTHPVVFAYLFILAHHRFFKILPHARAFIQSLLLHKTVHPLKLDRKQEPIKRPSYNKS